MSDNRILHQVNGKLLYCVYYRFAWLERDSKGRRQRKEVFKEEYMHAHSSQEAKWLFYQGNAHLEKKGRLEVIDAAPVVGWHAQDDHGDVAVA